MYRDDQEALAQRADVATREAERLRKENEAMRLAVGRMQAGAPGRVPVLPANAAYTLLDLRVLPVEERARLAMHAVRPFPVWLVGVLNVLTFGLFPMIHFGMLHDRLPRASHNDPSAAKAIGFQFIPYFNLYWLFFSALRLCDRLTLQLKLRGERHEAPRGIVLAACILTVIPYINLAIGIPILWTIAVCMLQSTVNRVAKLSPTEWDASVSGGTQAPISVAPYPMPHLALPPPTPEQLAEQARAQRLVAWSHVLGWGGLGLLVLGAPVCAAFGGATAGLVSGGVFAIAMVAGAIVGQIGRGMQGRAI